MYRVTEQNDGTLVVHDGPHYVGAVEHAFGHYGASKQDETEQAWFLEKTDAIEWLIAEFRGIPWMDRPEPQRVTEAPYNPT